MYKYFCDLVGLRDLSDLVDLPEGETSCTLKSGSRIDTTAISVESKVTISDAMYWASTLLSNHHKPLLMRLQVPDTPVQKLAPTCQNRPPEHHLPPVNLTSKQRAACAEAVASRTTVHPAVESLQWIRQLQIAMYEWANGHNYAVTRNYETAEVDERPHSETREEAGGEPIKHSSNMLLTVEQTREILAVEMAVEYVPSEEDIKKYWRKVTTEIHRSQRNKENARRKRKRQDGLNLGRMDRAWKHINRVPKAKLPSLDGVPLDEKVIMNKPEFLRYILRERIYSCKALHTK